MIPVKARPIHLDLGNPSGSGTAADLPNIDPRQSVPFQMGLVRSPRPGGCSDDISTDVGTILQCTSRRATTAYTTISPRELQSNVARSDERLEGSHIP